MTQPTERHVVVVDCETSGLRRGTDVVVEVAWHDMTTGRHGVFVPPHDVDWVLTYGDPRALELNGYRERLADARQDHTGYAARDLMEKLQDQTLAGANPAFEAGFLPSVLYEAGPPVLRDRQDDVWHHRLADLCAYTAGAFRISPSRLPGLKSVCDLLRVCNEAPHTAEGDVQATVECFRRLTGPVIAVPEVDPWWARRQCEQAAVLATAIYPAMLAGLVSWYLVQTSHVLDVTALTACVIDDAERRGWTTDTTADGFLVAVPTTPRVWPPVTSESDAPEVLQALADLLDASGWRRLEAFRSAPGAPITGYSIDSHSRRWAHRFQRDPSDPGRYLAHRVIAQSEAPDVPG